MDKIDKVKYLKRVIIICWVALAIVFSKWWIALFALLFMTSTVHKYYRICDMCGKHSEYANTYNEALDKAKVAGWLHIAESDKDYCPDCQC
jgi:hypothetical protein